MKTLLLIVAAVLLISASVFVASSVAVVLFVVGVFAFGRGVWLALGEPQGVVWPSGGGHTVTRNTPGARWHKAMRLWHVPGASDDTGIKTGQIMQARIDAATARYLASDAENADAILEADIDAVMRPEYATSDALARNAADKRPPLRRARRDAAAVARARARSEAAARPFPSPPIEVGGMPPANAKHRVLAGGKPLVLGEGVRYADTGRKGYDVERVAIYSDGSAEPVDFLEVPRA